MTVSAVIFLCFSLLHCYFNTETKMKRNAQKKYPCKLVRRMGIQQPSGTGSKYRTSGHHHSVTVRHAVPRPKPKRCRYSCCHYTCIRLSFEAELLHDTSKQWPILMALFESAILLYCALYSTEGLGGSRSASSLPSLA